MEKVDSTSRENIFGVVDINPCIQTCLCHSHLYCSILDACNSTEICRV